MSDVEPRQTPRWEWIGAALFIAVAGVYCFSAPPADNDLWGHIHFGREILEAGLPATNQYAYTAPDHPWINHEILAECAFAATYEWFGSSGVLGLKLLVGLATLALMARSSIERATVPLVWGVALLLAASLMAWGFLVRPQIFTFLGLAWVWDRILAHDRLRDWRTLRFLPLVFALWVNTHGGVLAGLGIFLAYVAVRVLSPQGSERPVLLLLASLSVAALALNPYGIALPGFILWDVSQHRQISEWLPIPLFDGSWLLFKATVVALAASAAFAPRARRWELALIGLAAVAAFRHQRHVPLFAIVAAPYVTEILDSGWRALRDHLGLRLSAPFPRTLLAAGAGAVAGFELVRIVSIHHTLGFQLFVSPLLFPVDAARFIKQNELAGNLAVPFDWGEYAIWHLSPRCRVSIDGRYTTAYPPEVIEASDRFSSGAVGWDEFLGDADIALIDRRQPIVARMLEKPDWQDVYSDQTALVFVRKSLADSRSFRREWRTNPKDALSFP